MSIQTIIHKYAKFLMYIASKSVENNNSTTNHEHCNVRLSHYSESKKTKQYLKMGRN